MDNNWKPGNKRQQQRAKTDDLDDLLGDLLDDDTAPRKKTPPSTTRSRPETVKQGSLDENFYSTLAANAEDGLSDVSEADVGQMAKSIADLDDMDADLFGGKFKKKGSVKGNSSKQNTPRRAGTPRSRSTTPRASSPQARMSSPTGRGTSPTVRITSPPNAPSSPTRMDAPTSPTGATPTRTGSGKRRAGAATLNQDISTASYQFSSSTDQYKPSSAPGKMTDINNGSESIKPGQSQTNERPGTVPKAKNRYDFGDFNEDDPFGDLLDSDDDTSWAKPKRSSLKKKNLQDDTPSPTPAQTKSTTETDNGETKGRNIFDRPPTRSGGGNTETEEEKPKPKAAPVPAPAKKKDDLIFSDDDEDLMSGLGIDDKASTSSKTKAKSIELDDDEENVPAKSIMDRLLNPSSVSKHLESKERKEFVLDSKYTKQEETEDDFVFGSYQPSAASTPGSRPTSKRSVRFQDEDDIFGFDKPPSRGRSPGVLKKPDDMDWLEMASGPKSNSTSVSKETPTDDKASKSKSDASGWLGLKDDDDDDDAFQWMKPSNQQSKPQTQPAAKSSIPPTKSVPEKVTESKPEPQNTTVLDKETEDIIKKSAGDQEMIDENKDLNSDYLGLGFEIDPDTLMRKKTESPAFGSRHLVMDDEIFTTPMKKRDVSASPSWESGSRKMADSRTSPSLKKMSKRSSIDQEETLSVGSPRIPLTSQIGQLQKLEDGFKDKPVKKPEVQGYVQGQSPETARTDTFIPQQQTGEIPTDLEKSTDFFSFGKKDKQQDETLTQMQMDSMKKLQQTRFDQRKAQLEQQQMLQQQAQLQKMMSDLQKQYEASTLSQQFQQPTPSQSLFGQMGHNMGSLMAADVPVSLLDAESKIRKLEIDRDYAMSLLESTKKRYEEEIAAIETSYKSRITLLEETHKSKEERLRDDNEQQLQQYLTRIRNIEQDKSDQQSQYYRKLDEFDREKSQELEKIKDIHRNAMEQLRKDNEETLLRLKRAKDQQIEVAAESHNTTRALVEAAEMIQLNAKDLGDLHKKVDNWHSMGLDEREISLRSKDEQLRMLQERLTKQQDENENERHRLEDLVSKLETQLREQTRVLDEERWRVKQEQARNMSQQTSLEEERRLWTEQQARERANIERTRETLLEEQKSILSQLHRERQSLAEERAAFSVSQKLQRDEGEEYNLKLSQAKAEFEATMKAISEEKSKSFNRKQEILKEEERMKEESRLFEQKQNKLKNKEAELIDAATVLKERSEEVDEMYMEAQRKFEEGMKALEKSQVLESEENMRLSNIQGQIQVLRVKEKEIAEERLRLSKEKKEVENLKQTLLCPNCRTPSSGNGLVRPVVNGPMVMIPNNNIPIMQPATSSPIISSNLVQTVHNTHVQNPALQNSINSVEAITESIKNDRSIRLWKMEAVKDKQYLEEQSLFLYTLKHMPYNQSTQDT